MSEHNNIRSQGSMVAVLALVVAGIALVFALAAYDRAGRAEPSAAGGRGELEEGEESATPVATAQSIARARAESRLAALEARLAAQEGYAEAAEEVGDIRADLREAYDDASATAQEEWSELDEELAALEAKIREESADALQLLQNLLERLRRDVASDTND